MVSSGVERSAPDFSLVHPDGALHATLEFVAQGSGALSLAGQSYALVPGMLFAHGPGVPLRLTGDPRTTLVRYTVAFTGTEALALLERHGPAPGSVVHTSAPRDVLELFDELLRATQRTSALAPRIAALVLEHLVLRVSETSVEHGVVKGAAFGTYLRCREHIARRWGEISTLEQLARECRVDPAYVCRLFRRYDRQSPYQYLMHQKMAHAADRLTASGASVKVVAEELGFCDPFHFSRVFRRVMGVPPARFARLHHGADAAP